ncbi:MAG: hypothetical protein JW963_06150 [Anaerolineales bacterium]|nr:hypothetical protein [Anaerolineales bacterium]
MNYSFYENRTKEKVREVLEEGRRSQAFNKFGAPKINLLRKLPKYMLVLLGILGLVMLFMR